MKSIIFIVLTFIFIVQVAILIKRRVIKESKKDLKDIERFISDCENTIEEKRHEFEVNKKDPGKADFLSSTIQFWIETKKSWESIRSATDEILVRWYYLYAIDIFMIGFCIYQAAYYYNR